MAKEKNNQSKASKIINIISIVILSLCACLLVYATVAQAKSGMVKFFSYSFHTIQTQSMEPEIKVGDLVIVKEVPFSEIKVGDDILFKCEDKSSAVYGKYIVHRVKELTEVEGVYKTYGINNNGIEDKVLSKALGKAVAVSSTFGAIFSFLTNWKGIIVVIAIIVLIIFTILQVFAVVSNASKYKQAKEEKKLKNNTELKEKLKQELLAEIQAEQENTQENVQDEVIDNSKDNTEDDKGDADK